MGDDVADEEVKTLATALKYAHGHGVVWKATELQLSHNHVSDGGFEDVADLLAKGVLGKALTCVELEYNEASPKAKGLVRAASRSRGITLHA